MPGPVAGPQSKPKMTLKAREAIALVDRPDLTTNVAKFYFGTVL